MTLGRSPSPEVNDAPTLVAGTEHILGRRLAGRFRIDRCIGKGGSAIVYAGIDLKSERRIAVKIARTRSHDNLLARFERDATLRAMFDHPNAVRTFASGVEDDGTLFMVSELVGGVSLASVLQGHKNGIAEGTTLRIIDQIASALESSHLIGLIHGDIKPANVLVHGTDAKIDFGFSRLTLDPTTGAPALDPLGPPLYKPVYSGPEQLRRGQIDGRTDIYALGAVTYHCLAGAPPFRGSIEELRRAHLAAPVPAIDGASRRANELVRSMLEKDPRRRISSMDEVRDRIRGVRGSTRAEPVTLLASMPVRE